MAVRDSSHRPAGTPAAAPETHQRTGPPATAHSHFTVDDFAARMSRAAGAASDAGLAGLLVTPGPDLLYLTGYRPVAVTERLTLLVLAARDRPAMLVPRLERPDAEGAPGAGALRLLDWIDGTDPYAAAAPLLRPEGRYGISDSAWAMHLVGLQRVLPETSYLSLTESMPMLRAVKDADELARMADAGASADATYEEIVEVRFEGRKETEVAADLAALLRKHGHSQVDFTVVGSGPNGATGIACQDVDRVARGVITKAGYGDYFIHRTGHGIGLTTHEPPYMVEGETHELVPGMCFSIEPGIYLPGEFGVRIEDIVTVTVSGGQRLNNTSHELRTVA